MGSQLLQNTEIIKQTDVLLWKILRKYGSISYLFSCTYWLALKVKETNIETKTLLKDLNNHQVLTFSG